jgi:hypothetical protein
MILMRKFTVLVMSVLVFSACALAQMEPQPLVVPNTELFIGYAFQHADTSGSDLLRVNGVSTNLVDVNSTNLNGFAFEFTHYLPSRLGFTFDISRGSNKSVDPTGIQYTRMSYMAGPSYRLHQIAFLTPSIHVLAGVDHDSFTIPTTLPSTFNQTDLAFAALAGGTLDGNLSRHVAIRLAQVDYLYTHHYGTNQSSFRYAGGLVVRF